MGTTKKQLPEFEALVAAGNELNVLLTPNPPIPSGGITRGNLAKMVSVAAGLLEPTDMITTATAACLAGLGVTHRAQVTIPPEPPAEGAPSDPAKGEEGKDQHTPKQPAKTPKTKPSSEAKKAPPKKAEPKPPKPPGSYKRGLELICKEPDLEKKVYLARLKEAMGDGFVQSSADIAYGDARRIIRLLRENGLMRKGKAA